MAGIVGSAIAGEAVRRLSSVLSGEDGRDRETTEIKVERLEMAVLKLETVVTMSEDWQITHAPLLRWKAKLKRVLKEGKRILRSNRRNTVRANMSNSFPRRMARVAKRFMPFSRASFTVSFTTARNQRGMILPTVMINRLRLGPTIQQEIDNEKKNKTCRPGPTIG
jgi:hypothetical protein